MQQRTYSEIKSVYGLPEITIHPPTPVLKTRNPVCTFRIAISGFPYYYI